MTKTTCKKIGICDPELWCIVAFIFAVGAGAGYAIRSLW